jgi:hypothetical protein
MEVEAALSVVVVEEVLAAGRGCAGPHRRKKVEIRW